MKKQRVVCMGFMGRCPIAGVIWQHLHYIVGLLRLGHEVYYVEDTLSPCYDPIQFTWGDDSTYAAATLERLSREYGFEGRWAFCARHAPGMPCAGLDREKLRELYRTADAIFNICGAQEFNDDLLLSDRILYIESDPGVEQIKVDTGDPVTLEYLRRHAKLFTFGENIGSPAFPVPLHGLEWLPTRQPVATDLWLAPPPAPGARFTSIANWNTSGKKDIAWRGETYLWSKSLEFLKFIDAPTRSGETFELATDIPDPAICRRFESNGWLLSLPHDLSADWDLYRRFIQGSKGEFTAAKDQYVRLDTGWFSDRTACYLAAGRPAITQATGFTRFYGAGQKGLFAFSTPDEIPEAVRAINADYAAHSAAAHEIAREFFEAEKVVAAILDRT
jgi:hypothetical protein